MKQIALTLSGGIYCGPLFAGQPLRMAPKNHGTRMPGIHRRNRERRQTPAWADPNRTYEMYAIARIRTRETGITHSVEHIVPLGGRLVCGLHWHGNMTVVPLRDNLVKGTRWWPQMWEQQTELFA